MTDIERRSLALIIKILYRLCLHHAIKVSRDLEDEIHFLSQQLR